MAGLGQRPAFDADAAIKRLPPSEGGAQNIIGEIASVQIEDGMSFVVTSAPPIMVDAGCPGIRISWDA
jgi:hypothetical protein